MCSQLHPDSRDFFLKDVDNATIIITPGNPDSSKILLIISNKANSAL